MGRRRKVDIIHDLENNKDVTTSSNTSVNNTDNSTASSNTEVVVKKKRGRKPKNRTESELKAMAATEKVVKKRGRRPKEKYNFDTDPLTYTYNNENDSIIVRLPVKTSDIQNSIQNDITSYNPEVTTPEPYDPNLDSSNFAGLEGNNINIEKPIDIKKENIKIENNKDNENENDSETMKLPEINESKKQIDVILNNKYQKENKLNILEQFVNLTGDKDYPKKTDGACFWCAHNFDTIPWGIPLSYEDEKFKLYGIFCSPNCACAKLFDSDMFRDRLWEIESLLNYFYYLVYNKIKKVYPAPLSECLQKFNGKMTYEEFRRRSDENESVYIMKFPPVISVIPVIEEINLKKIQSDNTFIPVDKSRIIKANNDLRLKRSKPISNKNTLDSYMKLGLKSK